MSLELNGATVRWLGNRVALGPSICRGPMKHPRRFARVRPSGQVSGVAKIIVSPKAPVIDCTIVDYSAGGACLQVDGSIQLPPRFELLHGRTKKRCRLVWKAGHRIGVAF